MINQITHILNYLKNEFKVSDILLETFNSGVLTVLTDPTKLTQRNERQGSKHFR